MAGSRRSRLLVIAAALLLLVFIVVSSQGDDLNNRNINTSIEKVTNKFAPKIADPIEETTKDKSGSTNDNNQKLSEGTNKEEAVNNNKKSNDKSADLIPTRPKNEITLSPSNNKPKPSSVEFDPAAELQYILSISPVIIFSKTYCGFSKTLKNLLASEYQITPEPTIVELDKHKNGRELQDYIGEVSGRKTVPNLYVGGISRGGCDDMRALHSEDKLLESLKSWAGKSIAVTKAKAPSNS